MAKKPLAAGTHAFLTKSGVIFRGRVESETKTDLVLDVGTDARSIVTLAKNDIVSKDGTPYPRRAKPKPRAAPVPLVLVDERSFSNQPVAVVLFFREPVADGFHGQLDEKVPPPLRFTQEWLTKGVFFAGSDEYFELDVRIAYNAGAKKLFASKNVSPFDPERYDILVTGGIDNEPSEGEMRAFGREIVELLGLAHSTGRLALAYVSFAAPFPALERRARAHAVEARRAAFECLDRLWREERTVDGDSNLFDNMTYMVLSALAYDRLLFVEEDRAAARALFERIASRISLDGPWSALRAQLDGQPVADQPLQIVSAHDSHLRPRPRERVVRGLRAGRLDDEARRSGGSGGQGIASATTDGMNEPP